MTAINEISRTNSVLEQQNCFNENSWDNLEAKGAPFIGMLNFQDEDKKPKISEADLLTQGNTNKDPLTDTENQGN